MRVKSWRAFHTEGRIATGKSLSAFKRLPKYGFLSLVLYFDEKRPDGKPYREIVDGKDHYVGWGDMRFLCSNDPVEVLEADYPGCVVKYGKEIDFDDFKAVDAQAVAAVDP